jgi:hypothetical protein
MMKKDHPEQIHPTHIEARRIAGLPAEPEKLPLRRARDLSGLAWEGARMRFHQFVTCPLRGMTGMSWWISRPETAHDFAVCPQCGASAPLYQGQDS